MDTKPIFDYLKELEYHEQYHGSEPCIYGKREELYAYGELLTKMSREFERCVFQCIAENGEFKKELQVIVNNLERLASFYQTTRQVSPRIFFGYPCEMALIAATDTITYLKENYNKDSEYAWGAISLKEESNNENLHKTNIEERKNSTDDSPIISGTEGLAKFLGCGKSMAFSIIKNGILKEHGIQYMVGKSWKFNREKLERYITEHPELLATIRCKK